LTFEIGERRTLTPAKLVACFFCVWSRLESRKVC